MKKLHFNKCFYHFVNFAFLFILKIPSSIYWKKKKKLYRSLKLVKYLHKMQ